MFTTCPICKSERVSARTKPVPALTEQQYLKTTLLLMNCAECGHQFCADVGAQSWWYEKHLPDLETDASVKMSPWYSKYLIQQFGSNVKTTAFLDYGCGYNQLLEDLQSMGYATLGYDTDVRRLHDEQRTVRVTDDVDEVTSFCMGQNGLAIGLFDVMEHNPDPDRFVKELKTYGFDLLALTVPNAKRNTADAEFWFEDYDPPHLHWFSEKSMTRLFSNHGLDVNFVSSWAVKGCLYEAMRAGASTVCRILRLGSLARHCFNQPKSPAGLFISLLAIPLVALFFAQGLLNRQPHHLIGIVTRRA